MSLFIGSDYVQFETLSSGEMVEMGRRNLDETPLSKFKQALLHYIGISAYRCKHYSNETKLGY